jgi:hypothetical protein
MSARKEAFWRIGETCPKVREAITNAVDRVLSSQLPEDADVAAIVGEVADIAFDAAVSKGTDPLRAALIDCEEERLTAVRAKEEAESERDDAKREAEDLREQIESLTAQLEEAQSRV